MRLVGQGAIARSSEDQAQRPRDCRATDHSTGQFQYLRRRSAWGSRCLRHLPVDSPAGLDDGALPVSSRTPYPRPKPLPGPGGKFSGLMPSRGSSVISCTFGHSKTCAVQSPPFSIICANCIVMARVTSSPPPTDWLVCARADQITSRAAQFWLDRRRCRRCGGNLPRSIAI